MTPGRLPVAIRLALCVPLAVAIWMPSPAAAAGDSAPAPNYPLPTFSDWGGVGLWQTPTARMMPDGELAFTASHVYPYTRYNLLLQPLERLQVVFRYSDINNRAYGPKALSGNQSLKDKSIDAKLRLLDERRYLPEVAIGIRDLAGTGLFSGEYFVASKRFGHFDASLGLGWGYVGARGDLGNPLTIFDSRFRTRPTGTVGQGGEFSSHTYFRGPTALFGGLSWQTPWAPLIVKLEYDGNDYRHEPMANRQPQRAPWNLGVVYRLNRNIDLGAAIERGNTALFSLTWHGNPASITVPPQPLDPPPAVASRPPATTANPDWAGASKALASNAGIDVTRITRRDRELVVTGSPDRYFFDARSVGRMARVLDGYAGADIDWYTLQSNVVGMPVVATSIHRQRFDAFADHRISLPELARSVEQDEPLPQQEKVLYTAQPKRYLGGFSLGYGQTIGGPNAFVLYHVSADYNGAYFFRPGLWLSGEVDADLLDNYDRFTYDAPSNLPRVRTFIREYLTTSRVTMPVLQLTAAQRLAPGWYGMAYAGMLESMYGGVGGELLYRPWGEHWAVGVDANWVKQRGFRQRFQFRQYHIATGHVTGYFPMDDDKVLLKLSVGRYLAGDWGTTIDVSRQYRNGVRFGAWATFTNVSAKQFGEGSFDKGLYVSIPFTLLLPKASQSVATTTWQPLLRDGGARLARRYSLYDMTNARSGNFFDGLPYVAR